MYGKYGETVRPMLQFLHQTMKSIRSWQWEAASCSDSHAVSETTNEITCFDHSPDFLIRIHQCFVIPSQWCVKVGEAIAYIA